MDAFVGFGSDPVSTFVCPALLFWYARAGAFRPLHPMRFGSLFLSKPLVVPTKVQGLSGDISLLPLEHCSTRKTYVFGLPCRLRSDSNIPPPGVGLRALP